MGQNKAFLMLGGRSLIEIVADAAREAAGSVTIIGAPGLYGHLGFPVIADLRANCGPLAGIETALTHSATDWNLILACDLPGVHAAPLRRILDEALAHPDAACVLPQSDDGFPEPLCAAYNKRILSVISSALDAGVRKVTSALPSDQVHYLRMAGDPMFHNVNTPEEWRKALDRF